MIKKRKKKAKFNIVDGLVLLIALVCIASIVNKALVIPDKYEENKPREYRVEFIVENLDTVKRAATESLKSGDVAVMYSSSTELGTIEGEVTYNDEENSASGMLVISGVLEKGGLRLDDNSLLSIDDEIVIATEIAQISVKIVAIK